MRALTFAIGTAGLLVLVFAVIVMYQVVANDAANAPVPVKENAAAQEELLPDPPAGQPSQRASQA
jgi:hypothetical protein